MNKEANQLDKFKEAAREAECDTDEAAFDKALGKIAKPKKDEDLPDVHQNDINQNDTLKEKSIGRDASSD